MSRTKHWTFLPCPKLITNLNTKTIKNDQYFSLFSKTNSLYLIFKIMFNYFAYEKKKKDFS